MVPLWALILTSLLSGLIGALISTYYYLRYEKRKLKLDTLRRLAGNRFAITVEGTTEEPRNEFFAVLNEAFVVFYDAPKVLNALEQLYADRNRPERTHDNLVKIFKAMTEHLKISHKSLTDSFFLTPFIPGQALRPPAKIG
jgi:hypothetical protein